VSFGGIAFDWKPLGTKVIIVVVRDADLANLLEVINTKLLLAITKRLRHLGVLGVEMPDPELKAELVF
jgi:hypothetical protein